MDDEDQISTNESFYLRGSELSQVNFGSGAKSVASPDVSQRVKAISFKIFLCFFEQ
jgi:hypothetical protein